MAPKFYASSDGVDQLLGYNVHSGELQADLFY